VEDEREIALERTPFVATQLAEGYDGVGTLPVQVILHDVRSLYNVGAFFRTADAVQLEQICLSGITGHPPHREIAKTALGAQDHVRWSRPSDPLEYIETLRKLEFEVAAVETSSTAVDLFDWQPRFPVALLFGHEVNGLDGALLASCDTHVRLPMRGVKHSLNVATAGGVVLYELLRKYRRLCDRGGGSPDRL
jgi:23S rRNA (guanosine2251-2'-O)-methyltransferase